MKIKIFRVVESTEEGDNLLGYGFADDRFCLLRFGSKILNYVSDDIDLLKAQLVIVSAEQKEKIMKDPAWTPANAFEKMVQEQTDDIRGHRVEYQEYDLGDTVFEFGREVKKVDSLYEVDGKKFLEELRASGIRDYERGGEKVTKVKKLTAEDMENIAQKIRENVGVEKAQSIQFEPDMDNVHSNS